MRILFVVDHAVGISGPHRNVVGSLNALTARDDTEVVLVTGKIDADEPYASASNLDLRLGYDAHNPRRSVQNLRLIANAARGCDVVYVPSGLKSMLYAQAARWRKPRVVGPNVTPLPLPSRRHDSPGPIELNLLSDKWFEASEARMRHVRRESGDSSIGNIHHALDNRKFSPQHRRAEWKESLDIPQDSVVITYLGRDNEPRKGVPQLLDAFDLVANGAGVHLVLVGKMSESTLARISGKNNVVPLGFLQGDELACAIASSDIGVVPSSWENFPFVVLEFMASGVPLVASRTGGIPEQVIDGTTGLLVDIVGQDGHHRPDAPEILAAALQTLIDDPELRRTLGANGRNRAITAFSEQRLGDDLVRVFRDAINDR